MKLNKIFSVALAAVLCLGVLTACGGDKPAASGEKKDAAAVANELLAVNPISNQYAMDDNTVKLDIMLPEGSYSAYAGWKSNDQSDAGHIFVIEYTEGSADAVTDALETYRQNTALFFGNYPEFADAQANLENNYELVSGNGVAILVVASSECTDVDALKAAAGSYVG